MTPPSTSSHRSTGKAAGDGRITRDDIAGKLREIQGEANVVEQDARSLAATVIVVGVGVVVVVAFLLGRRRGRRRSTFVEIRRV